MIRGGDEAYIFKSFNPPKAKNNWANQSFETPKETRLVHSSDYRSVPAEWLGRTFLDEAEYQKEINPTAYEHEYLGIPNGNGGMVFENVVAETITEQQIETFDILRENGIIICESDTAEPLEEMSPPYRFHRTYRYGRIRLTVYHRREGAAV